MRLAEYGCCAVLLIILEEGWEEMSGLRHEYMHQVK